MKKSFSTRCIRSQPKVETLRNTRRQKKFSGSTPTFVLRTFARARAQIHRQPALYDPVELPGTDEAARSHLAIPMSPVLGRNAIDEVVAAARRRSPGAPN